MLKKLYFQILQYFFFNNMVKFPFPQLMSGKYHTNHSYIVYTLYWFLVHSLLSIYKQPLLLEILVFLLHKIYREDTHHFLDRKLWYIPKLCPF